MNNTKHNFTEEKLDIYDKNGNFLKVQNRKEFTKEIKAYFLETGEIKYIVKSVGALIINNQKELFLVQRGNTDDSPGLIDKTVGGHVSSGDDFDETIVREIEEEIGIQSIVAKNEIEFQQLLKTIDTTKTAVLYLLENIPDLEVDIEGNPGYKRSFNASIYMGIYNGKITQFPDNTAQSTISIASEEVLETIKKDTSKFTKSLVPLIENYLDLILSKII